MRVIDGGGGLPVHRLEYCPNKRVPRGKRAVGSTEDHKYKSCVPITIILEQISSLVLMVFGTYGIATSGAAPLPYTVNTILVVDELVSSLIL